MKPVKRKMFEYLAMVDAEPLANARIKDLVNSMQEQDMDPVELGILGAAVVRLLVKHAEKHNAEDLGV
jgi:hypothetical protein